MRLCAASAWVSYILLLGICRPTQSTPLSAYSFDYESLNTDFTEFPDLEDGYTRAAGFSLQYSQDSEEIPSIEPSILPSAQPSGRSGHIALPSLSPTLVPSGAGSHSKSLFPTVAPTVSPTELSVIVGEFVSSVNVTSRNNKPSTVISSRFRSAFVGDNISCENHYFLSRFEYTATEFLDDSLSPSVNVTSCNRLESSGGVTLTLFLDVSLYEKTNFPDLQAFEEQIGNVIDSLRVSVEAGDLNTALWNNLNITDTAGYYVDHESFTSSMYDIVLFHSKAPTIAPTVAPNPNNERKKNDGRIDSYLIIGGISIFLIIFLASVLIVWKNRFENTRKWKLSFSADIATLRSRREAEYYRKQPTRHNGTVDVDWISFMVDPVNANDKNTREKNSIDTDDHSVSNTNN